MDKENLTEENKQKSDNENISVNNDAKDENVSITTQRKNKNLLKISISCIALLILITGSIMGYTQYKSYKKDIEAANKAVSYTHLFTFLSFKAILSRMIGVYFILPASLSHVNLSFPIVNSVVPCYNHLNEGGDYI